MTGSAIVFMSLAWGCIIALVVFCYGKVLKRYISSEAESTADKQAAPPEP